MNNHNQSKHTYSSAFRQCIDLTILILAIVFPLLNYSYTLSHQTTMLASPLDSTLFILDFDATITENDTISALFKQVIGRHSTLRASKGGDVKETVKWIISEYSKDAMEIENERGQAGQWKTVKEMVDWQRASREVERKSFERVGSSGILGEERIGTDGLVEMGRQAREEGCVVVRRGFERRVISQDSR